MVKIITTYEIKEDGNVRNIRKVYFLGLLVYQRISG